LNATWYKTVAIYDWVSTDKQKVDMQLSELQQLKSAKGPLEKDLKKGIAKRGKNLIQYVRGLYPGSYGSPGTQGFKQDNKSYLLQFKVKSAAA
jgi:hypothetical protein